MKKILITKKLRKAIDILATERLADCGDEGFIAAIRARKIKPATIYKIMSAMRYAWNPKKGFWFYRPLHTKMVQRVFAIANRFDDHIWNTQ